MTKSVIDWMPLTSECKPDREGDYFVSIASPFEGEYGDKQCSYAIAEWKNKGGKVRCVCDDTVNRLPENPTAEERLLHCLFHDHECVLVDKEGFYVKYILEQSERDDFPGFYEQPECIGSPDDKGVFWAYLPFAPEGYIDPDSQDREIEARAKADKLDRERRAYDFYENATEEGGCAHDVYVKMQNWIKKHREEWDEDGLMNCCNYLYDVSDKEMRRVATIEYAIVSTINKLKAAISDEEVHEVIRSKDETRLNDMSTKLHEIVGKNEDTVDFTFADKKLYASITVGAFLHPRENTEEDVLADFDSLHEYYFLVIVRKYSKYRNISVEQAIIVAANMLKCDTRLNRGARLVELHAPDQIVGNEFGMIFETLYYFTHDFVRESKSFLKSWGFLFKDEDVDT